MYLELETIAYAVIMASRKLRHYFKAHKVMILTDQPQVGFVKNSKMGNRAAGARHRVQKKISHQIPSVSRFCSGLDITRQWPRGRGKIPIWEIRCDGAWARKGVGVAKIITSPAGVMLRYATRFHYSNPQDKCTNNTTEYEALSLGLRKVRA